jgi:hypothetical protein
VLCGCALWVVLMADAKVKQAKQMVAVVDARARRAEQAVQMAQQALDDAMAVLHQAEARQRSYKVVLDDAQQQLSQSPGNEQNRLWIEQCRSHYAQSTDAVDLQRTAVSEAEEELCQATLVFQKQQLRSDHLDNHAKQLSKNAQRISERRIEDEMQGQGRSLMRKEAMI